MAIICRYVGRRCRSAARTEEPRRCGDTDAVAHTEMLIHALQNLGRKVQQVGTTARRRFVHSRFTLFT
eukprot:scaffold20396_cov101-Isochrysis_galbana.AAC.7